MKINNINIPYYKNLYDNTTHGLSAIFYLNKIFSNNNKLKKNKHSLPNTTKNKSAVRPNKQFKQSWLRI